MNERNRWKDFKWTSACFVRLIELVQQKTCSLPAHSSVLTPGAPSHHALHSTQWEAPSLSTLLKPVQIGRNGMTEYLCPTYSNAAHTMYRGKDTQDWWQKTAHFGERQGKKKIGLRASSDSASGCPWQTSGQDPPGWSKQRGALRRFIWMDDNFCTAHLLLLLSPQRAHVTALKAKLLDNDIEGLFSSCIHFILGQVWGHMEVHISYIYICLCVWRERETESLHTNISWVCMEPSGRWVFCILWTEQGREEIELLESFGCDSIWKKDRQGCYVFFEVCCRLEGHFL